MNFKNRTLFHGDNIDFMRAMNSETVDLIATDPPFNKNRDFHATPDSLAAGAQFPDRWRWDDESHPRWTDTIKDDWPQVWTVIESARASWGDDMGAFLCFMGVRVLEMHRLLKPTGSLYLHCDPTASHYLKALLDAVFGRHNFRNEIVWYYKNASRGKKQRAKAHDIVLLYARDGEGIFNREDVLMPYESGMTAWRYEKAGKEPPRGKTPDDVIVMPSLNTMEGERTGYPTQKPLALYMNFIEASSNPGDVVLDPFVGCATTCVAAERLGRQWVGIDIWENTHEIVLQRLQDEVSESMTWNEVVRRETTPPERTDDNEVAAPVLRLKLKRALEPWQRLSHGKIVEHLVTAQSHMGTMVICAGCGRILEREFMHLDHINPRVQGGANDITNRILLCQPCNGRKGARYTLIRLRHENKKIGWMQDEARAKLAWSRAQDRAEQVRDDVS